MTLLTKKNVTKCSGPRTGVSSATVWTPQDCRIVIVWRAFSSTCVVQLLQNTDHWRCCVNVEQHTSLCWLSRVGECRRQRWACVEYLSVKCPCPFVGEYIYKLMWWFWDFLNQFAFLQEFFQRQRNAVERNGVTVRRHQNQQTTSTGVSQDLIALHAAKRSVQSHQGVLYIVSNLICQLSHICHGVSKFALYPRIQSYNCVAMCALKN